MHGSCVGCPRCSRRGLPVVRLMRGCGRHGPPRPHLCRPRYGAPPGAARFNHRRRSHRNERHAPPTLRAARPPAPRAAGRPGLIVISTTALHPARRNELRRKSALSSCSRRAGERGHGREPPTATPRQPNRTTVRRRGGRQRRCGTPSGRTRCR
jgi:hypothetical protein